MFIKGVFRAAERANYVANITAEMKISIETGVLPKIANFFKNGFYFYFHKLNLLVNNRQQW